MLPTIMYDTVKFVLRAHQLADGITLKVFLSIKERLQQREKYFTVATGQESFKGKLEGWNVKISPTRFEIEGSFQKFVTGDQFTPMTPEDVKNGIRKLSEVFGLPMELAIVSRLDVAINIQTEWHPTAYYACLGEATYYDRKIKKNTLYYMQSNRKAIVLYDKVKEMKANAQKRGLPLPANLPKEHLLRMEFRVLKNVKAQLKWSVTGATLYQPEFICHMLGLLQERYNAIYKIRDFGGLEQVDKVSDYDNYLLLNSIAKKGGVLTALQELEQIRPYKNWTNQQYDRLRKKLITIAETPCLTSISPLVSELDEKVQELTQKRLNNAAA